jgi:hypothetical protein
MKTKITERIIVHLQEFDPCTGEAKQVERDKPVSSEPAIIGTSCCLSQEKPQKYGAAQMGMQDRVGVMA